MPEPTLDDVTKVVCPDDKPYKCLPYGMCYGYESFCSSKSGTVETCFPASRTEGYTDLLSWCRKVVQGETSLLPHPSCLFACYNRFNASTFDSASNDQLWNSLPQIEVKVIFVAIICWLVCGTTILTVVLCIRKRRGISQGWTIIRFLRNDRGLTSTNSRRHPESGDIDTDQEEIQMFDLRPPSARDDHSTAGPLLKKFEEYQNSLNYESEISEKLQVVVDEHDVDMRIRTPVGQHKNHTEEHHTQTSSTNSKDHSTFGNSNRSFQVLEDMDLSEDRGQHVRNEEENELD